jgi:Uma2 family endonuclease
VRAPDVVLTGAELASRDPARYSPADVRLVLEVLSEGSVRTDRVTKFAEYAEVGIEHYWIVHLDPPITLTTFHGECENLGEPAGTVTVPVGDTPVTLELDALVTRRA